MLTREPGRKDLVVLSARLGRLQIDGAEAGRRFQPSVERVKDGEGRNRQKRRPLPALQQSLERHESPESCPIADDSVHRYTGAMRGPGDILYNFHWIVPGEAARAAQAYAGFLGPFLARHGIKSLINLRGTNPKYGWWRYERRVTEKSGIVHRDVMLDSRNLPTREMLVALFDAFDRAPRPFLIKCSGGQDRTSFAAALFLIHRDGWGARDKALNHFSRFPYLHFPKEHQRWLQPFLVFA